MLSRLPNNFFLPNNCTSCCFLLPPSCFPLLPICCQLDASGYKALIKDIQSACGAGSLSPPTLCRLGFHSVHIAASVGKGRGANGGFHAWPVEYTHPSNGGLGNDIKYLLEVGCSLSIAGRRLEGLLIKTALGIDLRVWWLVGCQHVSFLSSYIKQQLAGCIHVHAIDIDWSLTPPAFHRLTAASCREHFNSVRIATLSLCTRLPSLPH